MSFKPQSVGKVIASRRLYVIGSPEIAFEVSIGEPQRFPDGDDYYCPIQILGASEKKVSYAAGIDSLQALDLGMKNLASKMSLLNQKYAGNLRWIDDDPTLGFTMTDGTKI